MVTFARSFQLLMVTFCKGHTYMTFPAKTRSCKINLKDIHFNTYCYDPLGGGLVPRFNIGFSFCFIVRRRRDLANI